MSAAKSQDYVSLKKAIVRGSLLFNLDRNMYLRGVIERTSPTLGGYSLSGRIEGLGGGFVTLAVRDGIVAGSIWTPHASYEILPRGGGLHTVRQASNAHQCAGAVAEGNALHSRHSPFAQGIGEVYDDLNTVVDVLVVWTPKREERAGGEAQVRTEIDSFVAYANDAFERSGAFVTLNLVAAERVDYEEINFFTDLERLAQPSDGHMDEVHERRDALRADLVSLAFATRHGAALFGRAFNVAGPQCLHFHARSWSQLRAPA